MRIAIDISSIVYGTGVSVYTQELVKALSNIDQVNQYVLFAGSLRQGKMIHRWFEKSQLGENFSLKTFPLSPKIQTVIWNDWQVLPLEWLIGKVDVYHSPDWSLAPSKARRIITVHDLFFLKRPDLQQHPYRETLEKRLRRARDLRLPAIAVSEATKADLVELFGYPEELVTAVYEAVDEDFGKRAKEPFDYAQGKLQNKSTMEEVLGKYGIKEPYLLMVATHEPRKNLLRTIDAFSFACHPESVRQTQDKLDSGSRGANSSPQILKRVQNDISLVIAGKVGWGEQLQPVKNVNMVGYVSQDELPYLYASATGFLYPSLYEGFGIPILEAFSCGCPVLTSNVSSMPEVAGNAPIYVDPYDVNSIRQGIEKLIDLKEADRNRLIENGYKQMKKFSWQKAAEETLKIYSGK